MGIPDRISICSSLQEIFCCPKTEVIEFCIDMIEFEHLVEIRECIFDELVVAIPTLSGQQLCGRRKA